MGRFFNRESAPSSGSTSQDAAADYQAGQALRDCQDRRDDAGAGGDRQPADGAYTEAGRWAL
jgi:hypothetical protein